MKRTFLITGILILSLMASLLGACKGTASASESKIQVYVTDAPADNVTAIIVKAGKIEIHKAGEDEGEWITLIENPEAFDLLQVAGVQSLLGTANVTSGNYTQVRFSIEEVTVKINGEDKQAEVPSGKLKIVGQILVAEGETTAISLDFDAGKSVNIKGNGDVALKPVVKLFISKPGKGIDTAETDNQVATETL